MPQSMTGYGKGSFESPYGRLVVELFSYNHKYLDITFVIPREFVRFEVDMRRAIGEEITRGKVMALFRPYFDKEETIALLPNIPLAKQLKKGWDALYEALSEPKAPIAELFATRSDLFLLEPIGSDEEALKDCFKKTLSQALISLTEARRLEGEKLGRDIALRLEILKKGIERIETMSLGSAKEFRERLQKKLSDLLSLKNLEERIYLEVALLAEKADISEEIVRFKTHLERFFMVLKREKEPIGKETDFLTQELLREANTMASKSQEAPLSSAVLDLKVEIERIREQVQNVE